MNNSPLKNDASLPVEYREAAECLFPSTGFLPGQTPDLKAAVDFARSLGIESEYTRILSLDYKSTELRTFLEHFQNNLDLLIQKTWVDKYDENRKEKLQDDVLPFMDTIEHGDFRNALDEFGAILDELAYLLFGDQCNNDDFMEYTFRIDNQMGLFWWYSGKLAVLNDLSVKGENKDIKVLWAILLLGICYLTNF
jgi:hypothetical protein